MEHKCCLGIKLLQVTNVRHELPRYQMGYSADQIFFSAFISFPNKRRMFKVFLVFYIYRSPRESDVTSHFTSLFSFHDKSPGLGSL